MKNLIRSFAVLAAILSFAACQKEVDAPKDEPKVTHTIKFVAENPETKTTATIDKENGVVDYEWTKADENRFVVYEINGETYTAATGSYGVLDGDGTMHIMAEFDGPASAGASYQALLNTGVQASQDTGAESYDETSDVLMSEIVKAADVDVEELTLKFKRMVAFGEATLKNLSAGEYVSKIVIESLDETVLAADFDLATKEFLATGSKSITFEADDNLLLEIDQVNHTAKFRFAILPVENALLKVSVTTIDENEEVVGKYVKKFAKAISFERGNIKSFNIALEESEDLPEVEHSITWTSASDWATNNDLFSLTTQPHGYSVVLNKNNGTTAPTVNATDNDCRLYAKGTATISNGKDITKIVFNISTQGKKRLAPITASVGTIATQASGDETVVWTGKAKEITFTVGDNANYGSDGSGKAGQLDFDSIDATYLDDGTPDPEPEEPTEYNVTIDGDITGGTVSADKEKAVAGAQITVSYEAAGGYEFDSWNVTDESSNSITVTDGKFTMPAANVTVSATFNKLPDPGEQPTTVKFDNLGYESWGKESAFSGSTYDELSQTKDNVTFTYTRGTGSTYANTTSIRFYKDNKLKFDAPSGYLITSIEWNGSSWKEDVTTNVETCESTTSALSWSGSAASVTFTRPSNATSYATLSDVTVKLAKDVALTSIEVSGTPSKKTYLAGESFETAGLVATGKYEDNSEADITSKVDWKVTPSTLTAGLTSVKVVASLGEVESEEFTVNGLTVTVPATLTSISVKTAPTKLEYTEGDNFDPAGLVITRHYSDGTNNDYTYAGHTEEFSFSPALNVALETSHTTVTITYGEQSTNQSITVNAKQIPTYASLAELVAAGRPTTEGVNVNVTLTDEEITSIFTTSQGYRNGIFLKSGSQSVEIYCQNVPDTWVAGGTVSGTLSNCVWKLYSSTWELCPEDWSELNYTAPLDPCADPVIEISDAGSATITCATNGASIYYTIGDSPADPTSASTRYTGAVTMTDGQTIKAIAYKDGMKASSVKSAKYSAAGAEPFEWNGGDKNSLTGMDGVTASGLGSDYAASNAPYRVKLDTTGDYIIIEVGFEIQSVQLTVKMLGGGNESSIKVQESTAKNGTFTDVQTMTISGSTNDVVDFTTTTAFKSGSRAVKLYFTKGSNVGLGYIKITPKN